MFTTREVTTRKLTEGVEHLATMRVSHFLDHAMHRRSNESALHRRQGSSLPRARTVNDGNLQSYVLKFVADQTLVPMIELGFRRS
jgi:hypothetical protein